MISSVHMIAKHKYLKTYKMVLNLKVMEKVNEI